MEFRASAEDIKKFSRTPTYAEAIKEAALDATAKDRFICN
jgi:dihydrolipoamide dehydrogenase